MVTHITVNGGNPVAPGSFNVSQFRTTASNSYHRSAHFNVVLTTPNGLKTNLSANNSSELVTSMTSRIPFEVEATNLPGVAFATDENRRYGYGAFNLKPYVPIFDTLDMTVRSDSDGLLYNFFQSWMKLVINYDMGNGIGGQTGLGSGKYGAGTPYEVMYKSDYVTSAVVSVYPPQGGNPTIIVNINDCYPIHIGNAQVDWSDQKLLKFPVTLAFSSWYSDTTLGRTMTANSSSYSPPTA